MTIAEAVKSVESLLSKAGLRDARLEAEALVSTVLCTNRPSLHLRARETINAQCAKQIEAWGSRRARREPLAYVAGEQPFFDLSLRVTPAVLIPRPETEELVERALGVIRAAQQPLLVADVGTGSGAIGIRLALEPNVKHVWALDVSQEALSVARLNADRNRVTPKWTSQLGDLLWPLRATEQRVDLIIANLPYVRGADISTLEPELHYEPRLALDGGESGTDLLDRLVASAGQSLLPKGFLMLEIGYDQKPWVLQRLVEAGFNQPEVYNDLGGHPRIAIARWRLT